MNRSGNNGQIIRNYDDLLAEKLRLEKLIENQKNIIRHDFDELKLQFKKEIKPAVDAATFVKNMARPETRKRTAIGVGATLALDLLFKKVFRGSNIIVQTFLPKLLRNYTIHFLQKISPKNISQNGSPVKRQVVNEPQGW